MEINKLLRKNVRTIIPFKEDENEDYIEIKNPKEYVISKVKERIVNRIDGKDDFKDAEILEFLIKELTNIELNESLDSLLEKDLSMECKVMLFHITEIYHEIAQESMNQMKMQLIEKKTKKLEEEVVLEMSQM